MSHGKMEIVFSLRFSTLIESRVMESKNRDFIGKTYSDKMVRRHSMVNTAEVGHLAVGDLPQYCTAVVQIQPNVGSARLPNMAAVPRFHSHSNAMVENQNFAVAQFALFEPNRAAHSSQPVVQC